MNQFLKKIDGANYLASMLPRDVCGWQPSKPDSLYDKDTLFDLIDGGAEVYRALNVKNVLSRVYSKQGAADIFADLFDMGLSCDAFGAFHYDLREEEDPGVGQESEYQGGSLYFWRDRYFVSIVALAATPKTKKAAIDMGKQIAKSIGKDGKKPEFLALLPKKGIQKEHLFYFHDAQMLGRRYAMGNDNPLGLSPTTEGLLCKYRFEDQGGKKYFDAVVLAVTYKDALSANSARDNLYESFFKQPKSLGLVKREDGKWAEARVFATNLFAVLEASSNELVVEILDEAKKNNHKPEHSHGRYKEKR